MFPPLLLGNFNGFSANCGKVTDRLTHGLTDKSDDVHMERNFCVKLTFGKLMGIFTMNSADGWTDRTDDGHTDGQMEFQVESCLG